MRWKENREEVRWGNKKGRKEGLRIRPKGLREEQRMWKEEGSRERGEGKGDG